MKKNWQVRHLKTHWAARAGPNAYARLQAICSNQRYHPTLLEIGGYSALRSLLVFALCCECFGQHNEGLGIWQNAHPAGRKETDHPVGQSARDPDSAAHQNRKEANPYDPQWETYFEARIGQQMEEDLKGRRKLVRLWIEQKAAVRCATSRLPKPRDGIFTISNGE